MVFNTAVESAISKARFDRYRAIATSDEHAWELYRWNQDLVSALGPLFGDLEVALRNTIHTQLTDRFGREDWWASTSLVLDDDTSTAIGEVVWRHRKKLADGSFGPGKVIADLTLGTWQMLVSKGGHSRIGKAIDYDRHLWRPALRKGFALGTLTPKGRERRPTREAVHARVSLFQRLRNRAAHHEVIFEGIPELGTSKIVPLLEVWNLSIELLAWICPELAIAQRSADRLPLTLSRRP